MNLPLLQERLEYAWDSITVFARRARRRMTPDHLVIAGAGAGFIIGMFSGLTGSWLPFGALSVLSVAGAVVYIAVRAAGVPPVVRRLGIPNACEAAFAELMSMGSDAVPLLVRGLTVTEFAPAGGQVRAQWHATLARSLAAQGLGQLRAIEAVKPLAQLLNSNAPAPRAKAVGALGEIGDPSAVPALMPLLADEAIVEGHQIKELAAEALKKLGAGNVVDIFHAVLRGDTQSLSALSLQYRESTVEALVAALDGLSLSEAETAASALAALRATAALANLRLKANAHANEPSRLKAACARAVSALGGRSRTVPANDDEAELGLAEISRGKSSLEVAMDAVRRRARETRLAYSGAIVVFTVTSALGLVGGVPLASGPRAGVWMGGITLATLIGLLVFRLWPRSRVPLSIRQLCNAKQSRRAFRQLLAMDERAAPVFIEALFLKGAKRQSKGQTWDEAMARRLAAEGLGRLRAADAVEPLMTSAGANDVELRTNALWALGEIADQRALPALVPALVDDRWSAGGWVRESAAEVLHKTGEEELCAAFRAMLNGEAGAVERLRAPQCGRHRASVIAGLVRALESANANRALIAVRALRELGANAALPQLRAVGSVYGSASLEVKEACRKLIDELEALTRLPRPASVDSTSSPLAEAVEMAKLPRAVVSPQPLTDSLPRVAASE